jgi:hypothetical protein
MRRFLLVVAVGAALLLAGPAADTARAGKSGYSSGGGGRSFSSPSGRSYSSGSRGGSSFSPSGKSYSSGGSSFGGRGGSSFSKPSGGRSYSSGSGGSPKPFTPSPSAGRSSPAPSSGSPGGFSSPSRTSGGYTSPSGKSYSSGGSSSPTRPASPGGTSWPPSGYTSPSGKSYIPGSRPGGSVTTPGGAPPSAGTRPRGGGFDSAAAQAQRREESRAAFTKGQAPKPTYTDPKGTVRDVDPTDRRVEDLRRQLDHEQWVNRQLRERQFYGNYYSRPVVVYHDPYSSFFWWWLLDQSLETRAMWAYNHQQVMDETRYRDLLARDAQLEARVRQLEAQGAPRNPAAAPPGMQPDLMYTDSYVDSVYNPQPPAGAQPAPVPSAVPVPAPYPVPRHTPAAYFWHGVRVLLYGLLVIGVLAFLIWLVFIKRWGGTPG